MDTPDKHAAHEALSFAILYAQQELEAHPPHIGETIVSTRFPGFLTIEEIAPPFLRCRSMTDEPISVIARDCYRFLVATRIASAELNIDVLGPALDWETLMKTAP